MKKMSKRIAGLWITLVLMMCLFFPAEAEVSTGDTVIFGKYKQHMKSTGYTPADPEPIEWRVLAVEGSKALLLAEQPLVGMPYNSDASFLYEVTWETCSLRSWLNGEFLSEAFSQKEQQAILQTTVVTRNYEQNGFIVSGGRDTEDKVFVLSVEEVERYLKTPASRKCSPTEYAIHTGASDAWGYFSDDSGYVDSFTGDVCIWWLRNPGKNGHYTALCSFDGSIGYQGDYSGGKPNTPNCYCVRPAIWVSSSAVTVK